MDQERYEEIKDLFLRASEKPIGERSAFLDEACGDQSLRSAVDRLLAKDEDDSGDGGSSFTAQETSDFSDSGDDGSRSGLESMRIGDYHVAREIGRGAMGTVYEATQISLGRRVALKILPDSFAVDARRVQRFQSEARATARIHHPNIIPVYEVGESAGTHYYAMEYVDGPSLDEVLAGLKKESSRQGRVSTGSVSDPAYIIQTVERVAELAEGLEKAHQLSLVHRDVKPSNILVNSEGEFVLADFGLVRDEDVRITRSGERVGTLGYMAPEQLSFSRVDARADVYSLGATLYEALTLKIPFDKSGLQEIQKAILFEEPSPPRLLNPSINRDLDTIILHALEKSPYRRYSSAGGLAADLRRFLQHEPIEARPQTTITRMLRQTWKYRRILGVAAVLFLLVLVTSTLFYKHRVQVRHQNEVTYRTTVFGAITKLPLGETEPAEEEEIWGDPVREAVAELEGAIALFPERPEAHYFCGVALHLRGDDALAAVVLRRAISSDADFVPAKALLGAIENQDISLEDVTSEGRRDWAMIWLKAHDAMRRKKWKAAARAYTLLIDSRTSVLENYLGLTVESYLARGRARLYAEEFDQAIEDFGAVKVLLPQMISPVLLLAKTYLLKGNPELAEERLRDVYSRTEFPEEVAGHAARLFHGLRYFERGRIWAEKMSAGRIRDIQLSDFLRHEGKTDQAIEEARKAILSYPGVASAHNNLGNCLRSGGQIDEGIAEYRKALDLEPRYFWAYNNLGIALRKQGNVEEAIRAFKTALEIRPEFSQVYYNLGNLYRQTDKLEEAHDAYREAIRHNPSYAFAWNNLGITLEALDKIPEAAESFRKAAEISPSLVQALNNRGELLLRTNEFAAAIESLRQAIRTKPKYLSPYYLLARTYERIGDLEAAIATSETMLLKCEDQILENPDNFGLVNRQVLVLEYVSQLFTTLEKPQKARHHLQRAQELRKKLVDRADVTAEELGDAANAFLTCSIEDLRKPQEALAYARRAVKLSEAEDPTILSVLAQAHFELGQTEEAVASCEKAVALLPEESDGDSNEIRKALMAQLGEFRQALSKQP